MFYKEMPVCVQLLLLCLTLCNPMDYSPPGSSVCSVSQARILEYVAIFSTGGPLQPRDQIQVSFISSTADIVFTI